MRSRWQVGWMRAALPLYGALLCAAGLLGPPAPQHSRPGDARHAEAAAATSATTPTVGAPARPNIVVIMADDLDVASMSALLAMPSDTAGRDVMLYHIKRHIADVGFTFTNSFVTNPLCCPSRATFLTGKYAHNTLVYSNREPNGGVAALDDRSTIATWLDASYWTGYVGEYLNGYGSWNETNSSYDPAKPPPHPAHGQTYRPPGWDRWYGLIDPFAHRTYGYRLNENGVLRSYGTAPEHYQTDVLAQKAQEFIADALANRAAQPFFLSIHTLAPHVEVGSGVTGPNGETWGYYIRPAPRHANTISFAQPPYAQKPSFNEADVSDKPLQPPALDAVAEEQLRRQYRTRLEALRAVDDLVGTVVAALGPQIENTVLLFTSDNGYLLGEHRLNGKSGPYEESIRVPLYVRLPLRLLRAFGAAGYAPRSSDQLVLNNDLAPTIAHLAGITPPAVDGRSLLPLLQAAAAGTPPPAWRKRFLVEYWLRNPPNDFSTYAAVRSGPLAAVPNSLYAEYYYQDETWTVRWDSVQFRELYTLGSDRYQLQSQADHPAISSLSATVRSLRSCGAGPGQQPCATLENS